MLTITLDFCSDALNDNDDPHTNAYAERVETEVWRWLKEDVGLTTGAVAGTSVLGYQVVTKIEQLEGLGGGWPVVRFTADRDTLQRLLSTYTGGDEAETQWLLTEEASEVEL